MRPVIGLTTSLLAPEKPPHMGERFAVNATYCRAVAIAGGAPLLIPGIADEEAVASVLPLLDGLLLTGGVDVNPRAYDQQIRPACERIDDQRDVTELALVRLAQRERLPILGICRGIQLLNVALGGTLFQDIPTERPGSVDHRASVPEASRTVHDLRLEAGSRLADLLGAANVGVNSLHHQAIDSLAPGLTATGWSEDRLIEAVEAADWPFLVAVQCHPEHLYEHDTRWLGMFRGFVGAAAANRERQPLAVG